MVQSGRLHRYTYADYVALEESSPTKHEYYQGEIYAMAGSSEEHSALAAEVLRALGNALGDRPWRTHTSDLPSLTRVEPHLLRVPASLEHDQNHVRIWSGQLVLCKHVLARGGFGAVLGCSADLSGAVMREAGVLFGRSAWIEWLGGVS